MPTLRFVCLALLLAACGGAAVDPSSEYSNDDLGVDTTPAAAPEPAPAVEPAPSPATRDDEPEPPAVIPVPDSVPEPAHPAPEPAPEPEPAADHDPGQYLPPGGFERQPEPEPAATPEPEPRIAGGDICTADEQCVDGLTCETVWALVPGGMLPTDERRCAFAGE